MKMCAVCSAETLGEFIPHDSGSWSARETSSADIPEQGRHAAARGVVVAGGGIQHGARSLTRGARSALIRGRSGDVRLT